LRSPDAYAQTGDVVRIDDTEVERTVRTLVGELAVGDAVTLDQDAFPGDPEQAHGIGFERPNVPGELGPQPAWVIEGRRDTWVVFVHGNGTNRRSQALRMIPILVEQGFPIMVITYRNDAGAPPTEDGLRRWGLEEWRDIDPALAVAVRQGAAGFVLYGYDLGAEVIAMFLHDSEFAVQVQAVVLDSPVLDLERFVDDQTSLPSPWAEVGEQLAAVRFGVEWSYLDQIERAEEFDVPFLVLHGVDDDIVPYRSSEEFAELRSDIVELARFEQGGHGDLWNIDPVRYQTLVTDYLLRVVGQE
jgi:pimeloyl-ACP methyl ester carboxylesterase